MKKRIPRKLKKKRKKLIKAILQRCAKAYEFAYYYKSSQIDRIEFETGGFTGLHPNVITEWKPDPNTKTYKYDLIEVLK